MTFWQAVAWVLFCIFLVEAGVMMGRYIRRGIERPYRAKCPEKGCNFRITSSHHHVMEMMIDHHKEKFHA